MKKIIRKRRRREGKTNYLKRLKLLESRKPRLVVRKTNKYIIGQIVESKEAQDKVVIGFTSKKLKELNWNFSFKNLPACYLLGLFIGKLAKRKGIKEAILDVGLHRITKGNRIFAFVYGVNKFINVPCSPEILPQLDRIYGKHISPEIENKVKEIEKKIIES